MAKLSRPKRAATFAKQAEAFAWGVWTELGVPGWHETHTDWAIDLEPLLLFTAWYGDHVPRLRDEALDWCVQNWRSVSKSRLRNLGGQAPPVVDARWGEFAATVNAHSTAAWPGATTPGPFRLRGRSLAPALDRPSMCWLRMRAVFGVSARAEILRVLLQSTTSRRSVAGLATGSGYTKRNVADECDTLARAGVLEKRLIMNRHHYSLVRRDAVLALVGDVAPILPRWTSVWNITRVLLELEAANETASAKTFPIHVRNGIDEIADDFTELDIDTDFDALKAHELWPALRDLGMRTLGEWSIGRWHAQSAAPTATSTQRVVSIPNRA